MRTEENKGVTVPVQTKKKYRVYIRKINQTCIDVEANDREEAREKARAEYRKQYAHATIEAVECDDED